MKKQINYKDNIFYINVNISPVIKIGGGNTYYVELTSPSFSELEIVEENKLEGCISSLEQYAKQMIDFQISQENYLKNLLSPLGFS